MRDSARRAVHRFAGILLIVSAQGRKSLLAILAWLNHLSFVANMRRRDCVQARICKLGRGRRETSLAMARGALHVIDPISSFAGGYVYPRRSAP